MALRIFIYGLLEPVETGEPVQATMMNLNAAINNDMHFFIAKNTAGETEVIRIEHILKMQEVDD